MQINIIWDIGVFYDTHGNCPYIEWLHSLSEEVIIIIQHRIRRVRYGNLGDHKRIDQNIYELRFFIGPGYRIYFIKLKNNKILLLNGGTKSTQRKDIIKANNLLKKYKGE